MVSQVCLWTVLLVLFGTTATFIRLMPLFFADVASSLEALILAFLVIVFVPWAIFFYSMPLELDAFPFKSSIIFTLAL